MLYLSIGNKKKYKVFCFMFKVRILQHLTKYFIYSIFIIDSQEIAYTAKYERIGVFENVYLYR